MKDIPQNGKGHTWSFLLFSIGTNPGIQNGEYTAFFRFIHICYTRSTRRLKDLLVKTHLWRHNCEKVEAECFATDYRIQGQCPKLQHTALRESKNKTERKRKWIFKKNTTRETILYSLPGLLALEIWSDKKFEQKSLHFHDEDRTNLLMSMYSGIQPIKALQTKLVFISQEINDRNLLKIDAWIPDVKPVSDRLRPMNRSTNDPGKS